MGEIAIIAGRAASTPKEDGADSCFGTVVDAAAIFAFVTRSYVSG